VSTRGQVATADEALALVAAAGVVSLVPAGAMPSLVGAVVGGPVRGSWWSHARGPLIYRLASGLEDSSEVLVGKLVGGKVAFLHRRLWPALYRVVTDRGWRESRVADLDDEASRLLELVERDGEVRGEAAAELLGDTRALTRARKPLEERALIHAYSVHTERGRHTAVLASWKHWAPAAVTRAARSLDLDDALAALAAVGIELAGEAPAARRTARRRPTRRPRAR